LADTLAAFDAANAADPNTVELDGETVAAEVLYARRMTAWLERVAPDASENLQLAVRAQHICRWKTPRADYPEGRAGYKRWRSDLARAHADIAGEIMRDNGYGEESVERVRDLLTKKRREHDPEVQALEDVACLVFLDSYFTAFTAKHDDDKLVGIVRKTWNKMSERGHELALGLDFGERERALIDRALATP
jgi:hypothetical protein